MSNVRQLKHRAERRKQEHEKAEPAANANTSTEIQSHYKPENQMTRSERAMQIWPILIAAAYNRQSLTYGDLAEYLEFDGAGVFAQMLDRIMVYCNAKKLPPLTCLVVNQGTGLPGSGLRTVEDLPRDREAFYSTNWYAMYPPQIADFEEASA